MNRTALISFLLAAALLPAGTTTGERLTSAAALRHEARPEPATYTLLGAPLTVLVGLRRAFAARLSRARR